MIRLLLNNYNKDSLDELELLLENASGEIRCKTNCKNCSHRRACIDLSNAIEYIKNYKKRV